MNGKYLYFKSLTKVTKTISDEGLITLTGLTPEGRGIEIKYKEGCTLKGLSLKGIKKNGVRFKLTLNDSEKRNDINRNNSSTQINEIILQLDRMSMGLEPIDGQYNHMFPLCYQREETFSIMCGEICSKEQNSIHWNVCEKTRKGSGYLIEVSAFSPAIGVLAVAPTISRSMVESLQDSGLLRIRGEQK